MSLKHDWVDIDILKGETRSEQFLAINPAGQIPVCIDDNGEIFTESNAILYYLARDSRFWPDQPLLQTRVLEWQFFEQYSHEPTIAVARFIKRYLAMPDGRLDEYKQKVKAGYRALTIMEQALQQRPFLVGDHCSIADISLFAYTHVADEGGFDLARYPSINAWIGRVSELPGFIAMGT